jgi:hypothetical protein
MEEIGNIFKIKEETLMGRTGGGVGIQGIVMLKYYYRECLMVGCVSEA